MPGGELLGRDGADADTGKLEEHHRYVGPDTSAPDDTDAALPAR